MDLEAANSYSGRSDEMIGVVAADEGKAEYNWTCGTGDIFGGPMRYSTLDWTVVCDAR